MERRAFRVPGFLMLLLAIALIGVAVAVGAQDRPGLTSALITVVVILEIAMLSGLTVVNPNEARVVQFFGRYVGTVNQAGFHWTVPLSTKRRLSLRVRNFKTARLKVSDADGNPVEIAAVVVWRVVDTFKAAFGVDNHIDYVAVQSEAAVRHLATSYPYEAHDSGRTSLRDGTAVAD